MATSPIYGWLEPDNTDLVKNGALAIRTLGNAIDTTMGTMTPKSIVDAKGDLIAASANDTPARLAVGANGETLVADSSTSTGLRYQGNYAAGKNKIINGDFNINQRGFSSTTTNLDYGFDRFALGAADGTVTYSAQTFTAGAAPVAGYEAKNFARIVSASQTGTNALAGLRQRIESVRTFAGQTVTVSFWAKASTGTPNVVVWTQQDYGTGGSPSTAVNTGSTKQAITSSWARYSFTVSVPSISGKTLGTTNDGYLAFILVTSAGSDRAAYTDSIGIQNITVDFWGVQVEAGNVATAFQTATGTLQGELSAAQRYYFRNTGALIYLGSGGIAGSTTQCYVQVKHPTTMRVPPTALDNSLLLLQIITGSTNVTSATISKATEDITLILANTASGLTATTQSYMLMTQNNAAAHLGLSAEL